MPPPTAAPPRRAWAVLALVVAGTALVVIDITIVTIGLPQIQDDLGGSLADVQWVIVAYAITMGAVTQTVGTLSDRLGRRRVYLTGIIAFTVASLACGLAPSVAVLDAARAVQGIGGAILMTGAMPLISDAYTDDRERTLALTTWGTASTAAGLAAPLLGGLLVDAFGWQAIFLINVPIGLAVLAFAPMVIPAAARRETDRVDWTGTAILIATLGVGTFALLRGEAQGWTSAATLGQVAAAAVGLAAFVAVELRTPSPTLEPRMFTRPAFTGAALAVLISRMLTIGGVVYVVQYAQTSLELSATATGLLLAPAFIAQIAAGQLGGKLVTRFQPGRVIAAGYTAKLAGALWLALALTAGATPWTLAFPLLVWGLGGGLAGAPVMAVAMNAAGTERAGMASGTIVTLASIGGGIGTAMLGAVYQSRLAAFDDTASAEAIAAAARAVLLCSAGLAAFAAITTLALINRHTMPAAGGGRPTRAKPQPHEDEQPAR